MQGAWGQIQPGAKEREKMDTGEGPQPQSRDSAHPLCGRQGWDSAGALHVFPRRRDQGRRTGYLPPTHPTYRGKKDRKMVIDSPVQKKGEKKRHEQPLIYSSPETQPGTCPDFSESRQGMFLNEGTSLLFRNGSPRLFASSSGLWL